MTAATPIHPGANVGVDLLILGGFLTGLIWVYLPALDVLDFTTETLQLGKYPSFSNSTETCVVSSLITQCTWSTSSQTSIDEDYINGLHTAAIVTLSACALATIDAPLHMVLFVFACVDTHRLRHAPRYPEYRRQLRSSLRDESQVESNTSLPEYKQDTQELYGSRRGFPGDQSRGESKVELPDSKQDTHELNAVKEFDAEKVLVAKKP